MRQSPEKPEGKAIKSGRQSLEGCPEPTRLSAAASGGGWRVVHGGFGGRLAAWHGRKEDGRVPV